MGNRLSGARSVEGEIIVEVEPGEPEDDEEEEVGSQQVSSIERGDVGHRRGKRKRQSESSEDDFDVLLSTPKKRKLKTTSRYIYETLFEGSNDYDVVVEALGREWKLHRLYLRQSPYFNSMFSGSWRESRQNRIKIQIADPNVTEESLHTALGTLYQDEIAVEPAKVIPVLASATLLQLEGLIAHCSQVMRETVNLQTVIHFHEAASIYGVTDVEKACLQWFQVNLLSHLPEQPNRLRDVSTHIMVSLIGSSDLFVMQTEFSVYVLLRLWLYLKFHPNFTGFPQDTVVNSHRFFQGRSKSEPYFLETDEGREYVEVFKQLRLNHLINHHMDMEMLLSDRIIPVSWLNPIYRCQWQALLKVDQGIDRGPQNVTDDEFEKNCLRCGRTLTFGGQQHMWRWTGFNMGLDLIVTYDKLSLTLKRSQTTNLVHEHEALMSTHKKRHVMYRVTVASVNEQKQVSYLETTGIKSTTLHRNSSESLLKLKASEARFPLLLSFNFMVTTPESEAEEDPPIEDVQAHQQQ